MIEQQISQTFLEAYKNKNNSQIETLRLIKAALTNRKVEKKLNKDNELPDEEVIAVLKTELKKRQDAIEVYRQGGREDLVNKEAEELEIIKKFLPEQLSEDQLRIIVATTINELGNPGPTSFGKVIGTVMTKIKGAADGNVVSRIVKEELSK